MVRRWMAMVALFATVVLAACGAPQASAKEVAAQAQTALEQGDVATLRGLFSPSVNDLLVTNITEAEMDNWTKHVRPVDASCFGQCFGPVQLRTWREETAGQTTNEVVTVQHEKGTVDWTFTLQKESAGWKLLSIKSLITDTPS